MSYFNAELDYKGFKNRFMELSKEIDLKITQDDEQNLQAKYLVSDLGNAPTVTIWREHDVEVGGYDYGRKEYVSKIDKEWRRHGIYEISSDFKKVIALAYSN